MNRAPRPLIAFLACLCLWGCGSTGSMADLSPRCDTPLPESELEDCSVEEDLGVDLLDLRTPEQAERLCASRCTRAKQVFIVDNTWMEDLRVLSNLRQIESSLMVERNAKLKSLRGLERLEITRRFDLDNNPELETLEGLDRLRESTLRLRITNHPKLRTTRGMRALEVVEFDGILISDNPGLEVVEGFDSLRKIEGLSILDNPNLDRVEGFNALEDANFGIGISRNATLRKLSGFSNLQRVGRRIAVANNPNLPQCQAEAIAEGIDTKEIRLFGNDDDAVCE